MFGRGMGVVTGRTGLLALAVQSHVQEKEEQ
jgi:hypothetical protein